jgi:hypothetical protein
MSEIIQAFWRFGAQHQSSIKLYSCVCIYIYIICV